MNEKGPIEEERGAHADHAEVFERTLLNVLFADPTCADENRRLQDHMQKCGVCLSLAYSWVGQLPMIGRQLGLSPREIDGAASRLETNLEALLFESEAGGAPSDRTRRKSSTLRLAKWKRGYSYMVGAASLAAGVLFWIATPPLDTVSSTPESQSGYNTTKEIALSEGIKLSARFVFGADEIPTSLDRKKMMAGLDFHRSGLQRCFSDAGYGIDNPLSLALSISPNGRSEVLLEDMASPAKKCAATILRKAVLGFPKDTTTIELQLWSSESRAPKAERQGKSANPLRRSQ